MKQINWIKILKTSIPLKWRKSLQEYLVESKAELEKLTSPKLFKEPNSKEYNVYIPQFKRNHKKE